MTQLERVGMAALSLTIQERMSYDRRECYGLGEGAQPMSGRYPEIVYTEQQATHFKRGPEVYEGVIYP